MGTNVGNLNATLSLTAWEFNNGLRQSETAAMEFATTVEVQSNRASNALKNVGGTSNRLNQLVNVGAQGLQDFASQVDTRGVVAGMQAASNNAMQFAAMSGSAKAGWIGLGIAVASLVAPRIGEMLDTTKAINKEAEAANEAFNRLSATQRIVATAEIKGGGDATRKNLSEEAAITANLREDAAKRLGVETRKLGRMKAELESNTILNVPLLGLRFTGGDGNDARDLEARIKGQTVLVKQQQEAFAKLTAEQINSVDALGRLDPLNNARIANKEREEALMKQVDIEQQLDKQRREASAEIMKRVQDYGSEMQRVEGKIFEQRAILQQKGVSVETMAKFDQMAAVDRKKVQISDAQNLLAEMGPAAGMSAGALRSSSAGVTAVNRAVAGTRSDQSIENKKVRLLQDQLKELQQIARGVDRPVQVVRLSGG